WRRYFRSVVRAGQSAGTGKDRPARQERVFAGTGELVGPLNRIGFAGPAKNNRRQAGSYESTRVERACARSIVNDGSVRQPPNLRAEPTEFFLDVLVAAIDVVDAIDDGIAVGDKARQYQRCGCAQIGRHQ